MKKEYLGIITLIGLILLCFIVFSGCNSQKHIRKTKTEYDSTGIKDRDTQIRLLREDSSRLAMELRQAQYAQVEFDSTRCPQIPIFVIPKDCDSDSLKAVVGRMNDVIGQLNLQTAGLNRKVKYYADGSFEVTGAFSKLSFEYQRQLIQNASWKSKYDSIAKEKEKLSAEVSKKTTVVAIDKKKTSTIFMFLIGIVVGAVIWNYIKNPVRLILKNLKILR